MLKKSISFDQGVSHLKESLSFDRHMCKELRSLVRLDSNALEFFTYLSAVDQDFPDLKDANPSVLGAGYLVDYLISEYTEEDLFFCDDFLGGTEDIVMSKCSAKPILVKDNLLWEVKVSHERKVDLSSIIYAVNLPWYFIGAVTSKGGMFIEQGLTSVYIKELIIGAFDGEGFLHCKINGIRDL